MNFNPPILPYSICSWEYLYLLRITSHNIEQDHVAHVHLKKSRGRRALVDCTVSWKHDNFGTAKLQAYEPFRLISASDGEGLKKKLQ
jgi:hypothetical protein